MVNYNDGEIIQPFVSKHRKAELKAACRHFRQSYPAILARPRLAWQIIEDYRAIESYAAEVVERAARK